jgi:periplasmic copper chaperone A
VQTYSNGEIGRWIGPPDADEPAARVRLVANEEATTPDSAAAADGEASEDEDDDGRTNLALGLGVAGLLAGLAALAITLTGRRRRA